MVTAAPTASRPVRVDLGPAPMAEKSWLRGLPVCRLEGGMVYVTLALDPATLKGPTSLGWSAGGLHATTPKINSSTATCCIPRGVFAHRAQVKLELLDASEFDRPVLAWTQFRVLGETDFRAGFEAGVPILSPLPGKPATTSEPAGGSGMPWGPSAK